MKRTITIRFLTIFVLGFFSFEFSAVAAEENSKPFIVTVENQTVSIQAKSASALEVLEDLGEKAGIEVRIYEGVEDKTVSLNPSPSIALSFILLQCKSPGILFQVTGDKRCG